MSSTIPMSCTNKYLGKKKKQKLLFLDYIQKIKRFKVIVYFSRYFINIFSARQNPSSETLKMSQSFYYKGNCIDKDVQDSLKTKFYDHLIKGRLVSCRLFGTHCNPANMQVYCGGTDLV